MSANPTPILYGFWRSSATWRVRLVLAIKQIEYLYRPIDLTANGGEQLSDAHAARNPMRQVPVLEIAEDSGPTVVIGQSLAIAEYLEERFPAPPLLPSDRVARARVRQIAETINSGIQPLANTAVRNVVRDDLGGDDVAWCRRWLGGGLAAVERMVAQTRGRFAVGDMVTLADICIVPQLFHARRFSVDVSAYPALLDIERACESLPTFASAHALRQSDAPAAVRSPLISVDELTRRIGDPALRIVDVRSVLSDPAAGRRLYEQDHIPGAIFLDIDRDLSTPVARHGGRHPLPPPAAFADTLGAAGIGDDHDVVVYDADNGMYASRLWWMLRHIGHDRVRVLDGGFARYLAAGQAVSNQPPAHPPTSHSVRVNGTELVDRADVLRGLGRGDRVVVDARAAERYAGEVEPIDARAGHIPGAINLPFAGSIADGQFLPPSALRERFAPLAGAGDIIVYCGSGVTACHLILAMAEVGVAARLYGGSWSDWISYDDAPIATGRS